MVAFIGIADVFALARQYNTTTGEINNLTSKYVPVSKSSLEYTNQYYDLAGAFSFLVRIRFFDNQALRLHLYQDGVESSL